MSGWSGNVSGGRSNVSGVRSNAGGWSSDMSGGWNDRHETSEVRHGADLTSNVLAAADQALALAMRFSALPAFHHSICWAFIVWLSMTVSVLPSS